MMPVLLISDVIIIVGKSMRCDEVRQKIFGKSIVLHESLKKKVYQIFYYVCI